jgi:hypothetical protein
MPMTKLQAFFAFVGLAAGLNAQPMASDIQLDPDMKQRIAKYREDIKSTDATTKTHALDAVTNIQPALTLLVPLAARQEVAKMRQAGIDYQQRRIDKMEGASAGGGATTSAVSKTGVSDLFSAALENGALNRTQEGTATTFRVNGYGVYSLFHPPAGSCSITNPLCDSVPELTLRGLSASITIDNSTGQGVVPMNTQTTGGASPTQVGVARQGGRISSVGGRFDLLRRSRIQPKDYDPWKKAVATAQTAADNFSKALANTEEIDPELKAFTACVSDGFAKVTEQLDLEKAYKTCLLVLYDKIPGSKIGVLFNLEKARVDYNKAMADALRDLLFKPQFTLEYTHDQPAAQPNQSTVRMIVDTKFWGRKSGPTANGAADDPQGSLTLNVGFTFYETIPQGVKAGKFRDAQAALQLDRKIGNVSWQNRPVISLAGYYQYQKEKSILQFDNKSQTPIVPIPLPQPASALLDTKGGIGIVQGKITIPVTGVISIPLAVSWSNRTELLKASEVRGQFGISIDLDKILGKSGAAQ